MTASSNLHFLTIAEAGRLLRAKDLSPVDLTEAVLSQIDSVDSRVNAYITVTAEQALDTARQAETDISAGNWKGPMHGIPVGIKDIIDTAGTLTSCHSALFKDRVPTRDATVVKQLKDAGAVSMGKTATWEFAIGGTSFDLPWPPARNPWNLDHDPAGSSSGSAAAVAAGMCLGALGTDTGGSIRGPAAWCGIAGFKPTYGLVSRHGVAPLSFSQDHVGPMCWTVEDCALMLQVLAARDPRDPASAQGPVVDYSAAIQGDLKGVRIGVVRHFFEQDSEADAPAVGAFENALQVFRDSGCSIQNVTLAPLLTYYDASGLIERAEAFSVHQSTLSDRPDLYGALGRQRIGSGAFIAATDYLNALRWRRSLIEQALDVMGQVDVLLMPTRGNAAMKLGSYDLLTGRQIYTRPFNLLGFPALSVCSGFTDDGLPLAMQVVARPFEDALALKVGHFFERQTGLRARRPPLGTLLNEER